MGTRNGMAAARDKKAIIYTIRFTHPFINVRISACVASKRGRTKFNGRKSGHTICVRLWSLSFLYPSRKEQSLHVLDFIFVREVVVKEVFRFLMREYSYGGPSYWPK